MANTIRWIPPTDSSIGSALIYRATDTRLESLGSRTIIATVDSGLGSYVDSSGDQDSLYRIQFWDGVGSSELSDVIGAEYSELLATYDDVIRVARLQNQDVGSEQVFYAIEDATDQVFWDAGDPIKTSAIFIDSKTGVGGQAYNITGNFGPIYQVREVRVDLHDTEIVKNTDYEVDYAQGNIKFTDDFLGSWNGKHALVSWVPQTYHILVKNLAALDLMEGEMVFTGPNVENANVARLKRKVDEIKGVIRPKGVFSTNSKDILNQEFDVVAQKLDRQSLYFSK